MRHEVKSDLSASAYDFTRVVWPAISPLVGGGEIVPVEAVTHDGFNKELDMLAGIDAWHIIRSSGIRGIASRVQWSDRSWDTFTIRYSRPSGADTEYKKRLLAIENRERGFLMPELTVQGYVNRPKRQGSLISCAVVRTEDLFLLAKDLVESRRESKGWSFRRTPDGEVFVAIRWSHLDQCGVRVGVAGGLRQAA